MRLALAQLDPGLGTFEANAKKARETLAEARDADADLVVFPELYLSGYAVDRAEHETSRPVRDVQALAQDGAGAELSVVLGFHERNGGRTYNSAAYFERGSLVHVHRKVYLVDYLVWNEGALYAPGDTMRAFDTGLGRMAMLVCNDAWQSPFLASIAAQDGARALLVPANSSTAVPETETYWRDLTRVYARMLECYVVFVNRVGTEAGLTYWGGSHVVSPLGDVVAEAPREVERLLVVDIELDRVEERRRELPLLARPRLDVLRAELERLLTAQEDR